MKLRSLVCCLLTLSTGTVAIGGSALLEGCTAAQSSQFGSLGALVLQDIADGKTLPQIETDVADALFGNTTVTNQVVAIVNNLLQLLLNAAAIPTAKVETAKSMVTSLQLQMASFAPKG